MSEQIQESKLENSGFKEIFFSLAKYSGSSASSLYSHLGKYDDIDEDEHRAYVWFKDSKALFYVGNDDIVGWLSAPISSAYGNSYLDEPEYFTLDGIEQGMSKSDVQRIWGEPDWKAELVWGYKSRGSITNSGNKFELCVQFKETNNYDFQVAHFEARLIEKTFEEILLIASGYIGCNESTVINELGSPDNSSVSNNGTKALFYLHDDVMFLIPKSSGVVERVGSPITLTNSKIESGYYNLHGVRLGDTKERVATVWGVPPKNTERVWVFSDKTGTTTNGYKFETELTFKNGIVEDFQSVIIGHKVNSSKRFTGSLPIIIILSILALFGLLSGNIFLLLVFGISAGAYWWSKSR